MELRRDVSPFGLKAFFLNPPSGFEHRYILPLVQEEYDVYQVKDYRYLKPILQKNPNSIVFININEQLDMDSWIRFINSFPTDPKLRGVLVGAYTYGLSRAQHEYFILKADITAGFVNLAEGEQFSKEAFKKVLDMNNAKGRRKYVRASCFNDSGIFALIQINNRVKKVQLYDISVVGFSCMIDAATAKLFKVKQVIPDVSITLGRNSVTSHVIVFGITNTEISCRLVCLFANALHSSEKETIHKYVVESNNQLVKQLVEYSSMDITDYSIDASANDLDEPNDAFLIEDDLDADDFEKVFANVKDESVPFKTSEELDSELSDL